MSLDADLIEKAQTGDRQAFAALVEQHYDFIYRVAWRWCGHTSDAEDIAQDVCVKLAGAIRSFRGTSRFQTWLYALTLNAARDHQRKKTREQKGFQAYCREPKEMNGDASDDAAQELWAAVRALPDKQCDAVLLVYGEGLSHSAAADVMNCSESTVSWHVHEARKKLKATFSREKIS